MNLASLFRSSFFRFSILLTAVFLSVYFIAGAIAFQIINADLDDRIKNMISTTSAKYEAVYKSEGQEALVEAINNYAATLDPEDEAIWLGTKNGGKLAGISLVAPNKLQTGRVTAIGILNHDYDERFYVIVKDLDDLRLISILSYEESDEIRENVLFTFGWATLIIILLALFFATLLARKGTKRLEKISDTLHKVAKGDMSSRVLVNGVRDDIYELSLGINEALNKLETTVESVRQVSTSIAHDLRTPINRLGIQLESMKEDAQGNKKIISQIVQASTEVRSITTSFDALLRIAQIEAGARKSKFKKTSLQEIAYAILDAYQAVAEDNDQKLSVFPIPESLPSIFGDRELITQLLANLIENSIRHAGAYSDITIQLGYSDKKIWLCVGDTGAGIPTADRSKVFERFYRLDKARNTSGSGLGLSLVKAIAYLHDAKITITENNKSNEENKEGLYICIEFSALSTGVSEA